MATKVENLQVGVIGAKLEVQILEYDEATKANIVVDISGTTTKEIIIQRPDKTLITRDGILSTDGTDGKMYVVTISGDILIEGSYYIQGYIITNGWNGRSTIGEFEVHDNLV